jgi:hypothetical protein
LSFEKTRTQRPVRDVDLIPVHLLASARHYARAAWDDPAAFGFFARLDSSPLTRRLNELEARTAFGFYVRGGCWNLALALHESTGCPIEVSLKNGVPIHAYVVDGDSAVDICGRRELADARAGSDSVKRVASAAEFGTEVGHMVNFNGGEWRRKATRAAAIVLGEVA